MINFPGEIPRHASQFFDTFGIPIHFQARRRGDIVLFSNSFGLRPHHIGILTSPNVYIHAPGVTDTRVEIKELIQTPIEQTNDPDQIYFYNPIGIKRLAVPSIRWRLPT